MERMDREHLESLLRERDRAARDDFDVTRFADRQEAFGYFTGRIDEYCGQNAISPSELEELQESFMPASEWERRSRVIIEFQCHDAAEVSLLERLVALGYKDVRVERVERVER